jgi:hypothetical protein
MSVKEDDEKTTVHTSFLEPCIPFLLLWNAAWYSVGGIHLTENIDPELTYSLLLDELLKVLCF